MVVNIGINGFGRIGKVAFLQMIRNPNFNIVAINARRTPKNIADLLRYDTSYGKFEYDVKYDETHIYTKCHAIRTFAYDNPELIPWNEENVDVVLECTGKFLTTESVKGHLKEGVKKVIISAPAKSADIPTFVYGVNTDLYTPDMSIISAASCTTNCLAPIVKVLNDNFGIKYGGMITVHAMTGSQEVVDSFSKKDMRAGRSASYNIIPATTGASKAIKKVIPELKGNLFGTSVRVPTLTGSYIFLMCALKKLTPFEEVYDTLVKASQNQLLGVLACSNDDLVSSDIIQEKYASIVDLQISKKAMEDLDIEISNEFIGIGSWYDNEWGYVSQMLRLALFISGYASNDIVRMV